MKNKIDNNIKLYEDYPYLKEHITRVEEAVVNDGKYYVRLTETIFFPEGGGQYADTGCIKVLDKDNNETETEYKVINSIIIDGKIYEELSINHINEDSFKKEDSFKEIFNNQTTVKCILDWDKRFSRMQNHSGEHILTGVIHNKYGFDNVGFHLSDDSPVTMDLNGFLNDDELKEMERQANEAIYANLKIHAVYPEEDEAESIDFRSKIEISDQIRLIQIGEDDNILDMCACCAPHVSNTGEIGIIKIITADKYKSGIRIGILCGKRAIEYIQKQSEIINDITVLLSAKQEKISEGIKALQKEISNYKEKNIKLITEIIDAQIEKSDNEKCIFIHFDIDAIAMKNTYNKMSMKHDGYVGVFVGDDENGYRFNAGNQSGGSKILAEKMRCDLDAKGGGSDEMIQGKINQKEEEIRSFFLNVE